MREERTLRRGLACLLAALMAGSLALADSTPQEALKYVDPAVADAKARVAVYEQMFNITHQLDGTVTATPYLNYGDNNTTDTIPPSWNVSPAVTVNVGYSYNRQNILNNLYNLEQARDNIGNYLRRGIYQALNAQAQMLQYQSYVDQLQTQVASTTNDVSALEARVKAGKASSLDLQQRKLQLENLRLRLDQTQQQLQNIQDQAAKYGLGHPADYASLRFVLPKANVKQTGTYKLRTLNVKRNQATLTQNDLYNTLQYVELTGTYATGNVAFQTNVGIVDEHPRGEMNVIYPGGTSRWSIGVQATIVLSSSNLQQTPVLQQNITQAKHDLASYESGFESESAQRLTNAQFAERGLTLDEQQLDLSNKVLTTAQQDVDTLKKALQKQGQSNTVSLQRQLQQALRDLQRAQSNVVNAKRSLYNSWANYVSNVFSYLDYIDAPWQVKSQ